MSLKEETVQDQIEIVGDYKIVQVRTATIIKRDGVEIAGSRSFHRYSLVIGFLDPSDNLVETDISAEPAEVQAVCNAVWTTDIKSAYKDMLIAQKEVA